MVTSEGSNAPAAARLDQERPVSPPSRPLVTAKDIYEVPRLAVQGLLAWTLPEAAWWKLSRLFGQVNAATHPERTRNEAANVTTVLRDTPQAPAARRIAAENWANRYEERFQYMRAWRPGGWEPAIDIPGAEHVSEALDKGHGIIFWAGNFSFNDLISKIAWRRLGLAVKHFSRPIHGFSTTRFGVRYLNAVRRGIEDRYLGERLMTEEHETQLALQRLRECLKANGAISITVGNKGRHTAAANFLGGRIVIATGPLAMGHSTGAAVLPVSTLRLAPGKFEVTIGAPIVMPETADGKPDYAAAVQAYADWVTPFVLRDLGQWRGWRYTKPASP
jgi:lauroyl/myristoyl acyltransferase